ncbi:hypothetical protein KAR52_01460 [Candidatus Pacearchaeota archaeon]|nr:hypothetical protein [Candidatus Pacearchaeota archaeon]
MHLKRQKVPKNWPIPRQGTAYVVRPNFNLGGGIPILVVIRDMMKIAQNRKEVKKAIHEKNILLNNKPVTDEKNSASLFDTITIVPSKKYYRVELSKNRKFQLSEIKENESYYKILKIINKKILKGKKVQLNLIDGRNFVSDVDCKVNDSVLINFKDKKIEKCLALKEKAKIVIIAGKHAGEKGIINKLDLERKMAEVIINENKVHVLIKQLIVTE